MASMTKKTPKTRIFGTDEVNEFIDLFRAERTVRSNQKIEYYNTPAAFDIETTSFFDKRRRRGLMYVWTFAMRANIMQGRTWGEFVEFMGALSNALGLSKTKRLLVYVHNLGYEFQFMRKYFSWEKVFSTAPREPLFALTATGIEFRCSYKLTNYSLATVAKNLVNWDIQKLTGDLDYKELRHTETPLTEQEKQYTYNDVLIITCLIDDEIRANGNITNIPLTSTGYVRRYCRNKCLKIGKVQNMAYINKVHPLTLTVELYRYLRQAFQGGFTHANSWFVEGIQHDIGTADLISSYPACLVRERFPMSSPEEIRKIRSLEELESLCNLYACFFQIEFHDLKCIKNNEHPISASKCYNKFYVYEDNGRVVQAAQVSMTITEQDYWIIKKYYTWDTHQTRIGKFWRMRKDYLPAELINAILDLYSRKTRLKGVDGMEAEYMHSKQLLNACFGMAVTSVCQPVIKYNDETQSWEEPTEPELEKQIKKYNKSYSRFLWYPWGVWVTAYARRVLFSAIDELGDDYIYSDTDAVYFRNPEQHIAWFDTFNKKNHNKLLLMAQARGIDPAKLAPVTIKGKQKVIGNWEPESYTRPDGSRCYAVYRRFKTLGAKRYMLEYADTGKISLTVSGINKDLAMPYLLRRYWPMHVFTYFAEFLTIPGKYTGKKILYQIDNETQGTLTDYLGNKADWHELSAVHMKESEYHFSLGRQFREYLDGIRDYEMLRGL